MYNVSIVSVHMSITDISQWISRGSTSERSFLSTSHTKGATHPHGKHEPLPIYV